MNNITNYNINSNDILTDFFGYISIVLSLIKIVPQIIKIFKTKKTGDLSIIFLIIGIIGGATSVTYGILIDEYPVIIRSLVLFIQMLIMLIAKIYFDHKNSKKKEIELKKVNEEKI